MELIWSSYGIPEIKVSRFLTFAALLMGSRCISDEDDRCG
jgi:hypothetical protein